MVFKCDTNHEILLKMVHGKGSITFYKSWPLLLMSCTQEVVKTHADAVRHFVHFVSNPHKSQQT